MAPGAGELEIVNFSTSWQKPGGTCANACLTYIDTSMHMRHMYVHVYMLTWERIPTLSHTHSICPLPNSYTHMPTHLPTNSHTCSGLIRCYYDLKDKRIKLLLLFFFLLTHVPTIKRTGRDLGPRTGRGSGLDTGADTGLSLWVGRLQGRRQEAPCGTSAAPATVLPGTATSFLCPC